jgi:phage/plasmid-associated DNA primase
LTGGDPVTLEFKGSNERPQIICRFNALATCNSRLTVRLEGDAGAWRRRLIIIEYRQPAPTEVIADLSERILAEEASGVLNWLLDGLDKLRAGNWQLRLTAEQQKLVDDLLNESEAAVVFARECLEADSGASLTLAEAHEAYVRFCLDKGWTAMPRKVFSNSIGDAVAVRYGLTVRNDISDSKGKAQRGWKGVRIRP